MVIGAHGLQEENEVSEGGEKRTRGAEDNGVWCPNEETHAKDAKEGQLKIEKWELGSRPEIGWYLVMKEPGNHASHSL